MTDVWSERAEAYRESDAHREGRDLELFAEWAEGQGQTALDVATGGGNVARILRDAGLEVVTIDSAPGMQPTVVSRAEEIPFADSTFDVVACRVAAHHFQDPSSSLKEMARVSRALVLVSDNLFMGEAGEEADRLRVHLDEHRERAVVVRGRTRDETIRDLALKHQRRVREQPGLAMESDQVGDHRRRQVIGKVADDAKPPPDDRVIARVGWTLRLQAAQQRQQVDVEKIAGEDRDVRRHRGGP